MLEINGSDVLVQLFESSAGLNLAESKVRFSGHGVELAVSEDMLGRVLSGMGEPIDGGTPILAAKSLDINGTPINPAARNYPSEFIPAACQSCGADCAAGARARLRFQICGRVRRDRHYL